MLFRSNYLDVYNNKGQCGDDGGTCEDVSGLGSHPFPLEPRQHGHAASTLPACWSHGAGRAKRNGLAPESSVCSLAGRCGGGVVVVL